MIKQLFAQTLYINWQAAAALLLRVSHTARGQAIGGLRLGQAGAVVHLNNPVLALAFA